MRAVAEGPAKPLGSPQLIEPFNRRGPALPQSLGVEAESRSIGKKVRKFFGPNPSGRSFGFGSQKREPTLRMTDLIVHRTNDSPL
jgi:hypothetical protein